MHSASFAFIVVNKELRRTWDVYFVFDFALVQGMQNA